MSEIYHTEPPTSGKVLLKTSHGDIDIELWSKECPLACRNFVQLSMEGYYSGSPIHRVISGFMMQTGDPTGTGQGGESIYGKDFKDEVHGRIKFNHRGQVAMANSNKPNSNNSQFFITFGECDWLHKKHTIFGKVTGNTIFNLMRIQDVEVDESDRPVDPIEIKSVEIINNPYEDIVPRAIKGTNGDSSGKKNLRVSKKDRKAICDTKLLSIGEDEEDDGDDNGSGPPLIKRGMHSSHDSKFASKRLSSKTAKLAHPPSQEIKEEKSVKMNKATPPSPRGDGPARVTSEERDRGSMVAEPAATTASTRTPKMSLFTKKRAGATRERGGEGNNMPKPAMSALEARREKYKKRKTEHGDREEATLAKLNAFTATLKKPKHR